MDCLQFRRLAGGDPNSREPALLEHAERCAACARYLEELRVLDARILRALRIDVPLPAAAHRPARRLRWIGLAASLLLALGIGAGIWLSYPVDTLAADVIAHIEHEPEALEVTRPPVEHGLVRELMGGAGAGLVENLGEVTYARTCLFRGRFVPHLVVRSGSEPVTVMLLPDEQIDAPMPIAEAGFEGRIVPVGDGSIAIVGQSAAAVASVEQTILAAMHWNGE